ncbi:MAG TPA: putative toxin-antitoxin system toxin component, PIN family [Verrucomicrobiae bacterium]|nr:putative toxin-antitoxin system toxin component, PIN family [Verrucomicrobiae bacterium]
MRVVFDANVVAGAVCWDGESYLCLLKLARRQVFAFGTEETLQETGNITSQLIRRKNPRHNATARLTWYLGKVKVVDAAPLGKQRSRDAKDDPYLAAALGAHADFIVTYDKDLLDMGKPFGIDIIRPAQFLRMVKG